jgi:hypothetical protein
MSVKANDMGQAYPVCKARTAKSFALHAPFAYHNGNINAITDDDG